MTDQIQEKKVTTLFNAVTTNQQSDTFPFVPKERIVEAWVTGTGTVGATIKVYGANTDRSTNGILLATINLSGTNSDVAGSILSANWGYIYVVLSGITGTGAAVTFTLAV
jgi:hypothetical protein